MHKEVHIIAFYRKQNILSVTLVTVNQKKKKKKKKIVTVSLALKGQSNSLNITMWTLILRVVPPPPSLFSFLTVLIHTQNKINDRQITNLQMEIQTIYRIIQHIVNIIGYYINDVTTISTRNFSHKVYCNSASRQNYESWTSDMLIPVSALFITTTLHYALLVIRAIAKFKFCQKVTLIETAKKFFFLLTFLVEDY